MMGRSRRRRSEASCWVSELALAAAVLSSRSWACLWLEKPERFIVFYCDGHEALPVELSEHVEPDKVRLFRQVDVVGLDDVDEGELRGIFNQ